MLDTLRLANRIEFDTAQVSITTPFPGTRYYEKLKSGGFLKEGDFNSYDGTTSCVFDTDLLGHEDIEAFRKKAIKSMVLHKVINPYWVRNFIKRSFIVSRNYGLKTALEPVMSLIKL